MKKKIFIAGAVREYDSKHPYILADEIKQHICDHIVSPEAAPNVNVIVDEPKAKTVRIRYPFSTNDKICTNTVSQALYRCFTGEYSGFQAKNSLWWPMGFGPSFPMNVRIDVEDIAAAFKKNAWYYRASRHKDFSIVEYYWGMEALITY